MLRSLKLHQVFNSEVKRAELEEMDCRRRKSFADWHLSVATINGNNVL